MWLTYLPLLSGVLSGTVWRGDIMMPDLTVVGTERLEWRYPLRRTDRLAGDAWADVSQLGQPA